MAEGDTLRLSFLPDKSQVVLIGTAKMRENSGLDDLPAVANNIRDLDSIFRDNNIIGLPNITRILDPPNQDELATELAKIAARATDTLVVYYAGHGLKARLERGLYLATMATTKEQCDANGFPFGKLRTAIANSPAMKKVLILDCCFAGEALKDEMGDEASLLASNIDNITGTYSIASSPANKLSIAPIGSEYTAFTGELIGLLREGTGSNNPVLTLDEVFEHLRRRISQKTNLPEPQRKSLLEGSKIIFAKNHMGVSALELRVTSLQDSFNSRLSRLEERFESLKNNDQSDTKEASRLRPSPFVLPTTKLLGLLLFLAHAFIAPVITEFVTIMLYRVGPGTDSRLTLLAEVMLGLSIASLLASLYALKMRGWQDDAPFFGNYYSIKACIAASAISLILMVPLAIVAPEQLLILRSNGPSATQAQ